MSDTEIAPTEASQLDEQIPLGKLFEPVMVDRTTYAIVT